ncbi:F-box protein [Quillaja saponaria]|uniref:F-box protein n=1 Tax=Quillaja saponaria TaxID=32244 RepID=A0AAD7M3L4_QUISA|nr:F-box protein [Quillaja saponaria]
MGALVASSPPLLKCDLRSMSIGDDMVILISQECRNQTPLKLHACRNLSYAGMEAFATQRIVWVSKTFMWILKKLSVKQPP